jgi:hypothetical protein
MTATVAMTTGSQEVAYNDSDSSGDGELSRSLDSQLKTSLLCILRLGDPYASFRSVTW